MAEAGFGLGVLVPSFQDTMLQLDGGKGTRSSLGGGGCVQGHTTKHSRQLEHALEHSWAMPRCSAQASMRLVSTYSASGPMPALGAGWLVQSVLEQFMGTSKGTGDFQHSSRGCHLWAYCFLLLCA